MTPEQETLLLALAEGYCAHMNWLHGGGSKSEYTEKVRAAMEAVKKANEPARVTPL